MKHPEEIPNECYFQSNIRLVSAYVVDILLKPFEQSILPYGETA